MTVRDMEIKYMYYDKDSNDVIIIFEVKKKGVEK